MRTLLLPAPMVPGCCSGRAGIADTAGWQRQDGSHADAVTQHSFWGDETRIVHVQMVSAATRTAPEGLYAALQTPGSVSSPRSLPRRRHVNTTWRNPSVPAPNPNRALLMLSGVDLGIEQPRPVISQVPETARNL